MDSGDVCEAGDSELTTACSRAPQLPFSFSETFHSAKTFFFLAASYLKAKKLNTSQEDDQFLIVLFDRNVKGVVSRATCEKVLKAFLLKPGVLSTREAVGATHQAKLSTMGKKCGATTSRSQDLRNYRQTHTHSHSGRHSDITHQRTDRLVATYFSQPDHFIHNLMIMGRPLQTDYLNKIIRREDSNYRKGKKLLD